MIPLARPSIGDAEIAAAERVLRSGRLSAGPEVERFEERLAVLCDRPSAVATSSGTSALELALLALGIGAGDRVLVAAFGYPAVVHALASLGAIAVPVDAEPHAWTLDLEDAERVGEGASAIVTIDALGLPCDSGAVSAWASARGLRWLSDAACGLGGIDAAGRPGGAGGELATLSFHPRKVLTTGEGGAITGSDAELIERCRQLRNLGRSDAGEFANIGTNARLSAIACAIGAAQCARLDAMLRERRLLAEGYHRRLGPLRDAGRLSWQQVPDGALHAYQTFAVLLAEDVDRSAVIAALRERDIESTVATFAFHRVPILAERSPARQLPVADRLHDRGLALPLYVGMRGAELDHVSEALAEVLG